MCVCGVHSLLLMDLVRRNWIESGCVDMAGGSGGEPAPSPTPPVSTVISLSVMEDGKNLQQRLSLSWWGMKQHMWRMVIP